MRSDFIGTTAERVLFPNNLEFVATNPQSSLLSVDVPLGLQMGNNPGAIANRKIPIGFSTICPRWNFIYL